MQKIHEHINIQQINNNLQDTHFYVQLRNTIRPSDILQPARYSVVAYLAIPPTSNTTHLTPDNTNPQIATATNLASPSTSQKPTHQPPIDTINDEQSASTKQEAIRKYPSEAAEEASNKRAKP